MNTTQTILATLAAAGVAGSAAYVALEDEATSSKQPAIEANRYAGENPEKVRIEVETERTIEVEPEKEQEYRPNRAKIHTRNTLLGAAAANELMTEGGGKDDRRKVIVGAAVVNELFRKNHERVPEEDSGDATEADS